MKKLIAILPVFFVLIVAPTQKALSDEALSSYEQELIEAFSNGQDEGRRKITLPEFPAMPQVAEVHEAPVVPQAERHELLNSLLDDVERLKNQVVITKRNTLSTQQPRQKRTVGAKTVFDYMEGQIYEVHAAINQITDIELAPGETLTNPPMAGDTVRWRLGVMQSGSGASARSHVVIKPLDEGIETNIIITTDRRNYHIRALSSGTYMPAVSWHYADEEMARLTREFQQKRTVQQVGVTPEELNFGYNIDRAPFDWRPVRVFDDGAKTFIQMPSSLKVTEAPVLFLLDESGDPMLANYRVRGDYYIVDRLFQRAELRVGKSSKIEIRSDRYKPTFWERLF